VNNYYLDASALVKRYVDEVGSICEVIDLIDKHVEFPLLAFNSPADVTLEFLRSFC